MLPLSDHIGSHLHELRRRLIISLLSIIICSGIAYSFVEPISEFLMAPLFHASPSLKNLIYTNLTEAFFSYMKLAILVGISASFPVLVYQAWQFAAPGLHAHEKSTVRVVVFLASGLFVGGVAFAYWFVLPQMLRFLMGFSRENLTPMPKFGEYLTFMARTGLAFGLAFEIPFLMAATAKIGLIDKEHFHKKRLYFYLTLLGLSFLLTAGDPLSAILLTIPLCGLYEIGAQVVRLTVRHSSP
ncbi:MAG: twin-arginine translocase subunit TatC [Desulfobulbaceae bacterium]|nr:twin-arginine translocase subunit TatC [Desulfobulbaceae bacterium]